MNTLQVHTIDPLLGVVLNGNYRANRFIGRGAMGTIYEGTHIRLNKRVALKVISRDLSGNPLALDRFRREAEVTSQLGHPHIVNVFDFGTTPSGEPYMAMEYLEGEDLEARIRRGEQIPLGAVTLIVRQVASALSATHAGGIVHRDLKPANIFLVRVEGEPEFAKVVDFGISKVQAAGARVTGGSGALGTPQFMSPEQAMGRPDEIDHRTDQWSLACIAYEALTGHSPFTGEDAVALIYQVVHEEPPSPRVYVPALPVALEAVFRRALAKQPVDRFESITAFARAFEAAAGLSAEALRLSQGAHPAGIAVPFDPDDRTVFDGGFAFGQTKPRLPRTLVPRVLLLAALAVSLLSASIWLVRARRPDPATAAAPTVAQPVRKARPVADRDNPRPVVDRDKPRPVVDRDKPRPVVDRDKPRPVPLDPAPAPVNTIAEPAAIPIPPAVQVQPKKARPRAQRQLIEEL